MAGFDPGLATPTVHDHESTLAHPTRAQAAGAAAGRAAFRRQPAWPTGPHQGDPPAWQAALTQDQLARQAQAAAGVEGDFAVGLTDAAGRTFLAVDRFAIRTLCYRVIDGALHYAERADDLAALPPRAEIDPQAIFDYLYFHVIPSPRTIFKGVHRLPPAHYAWFENGQLTVAPYWVPQFHEPAQADFPALAAEFRQLVQDAVATQLDGSKPACFLSGGTDSSTVAGMISQTAGRPAATYSIGFEAEGYDEMQYARIAAQRFGTEHHEYYVTPDDLVRSIPAVAAHYDQPFGNSSACPRTTAPRWRARRRHHACWPATAATNSSAATPATPSNASSASTTACPRRCARACWSPCWSARRWARCRWRARAAATWSRPRCRCPTACRCTTCCCAWARTQVFDARLPGPGGLKPTRCASSAPCGSRCQARQRAEPHAGLRLALHAGRDRPAQGVRQHALAGVAVGYPLLDQRLVDFSLRLPTDYKLKGLKLRWFFKEALRGFLPDEILTKKKQGFGLPFGVWATRHDRLAALRHRLTALAGQRGIVRPEFIDTLLEAAPAGPPGLLRRDGVDPDDAGAVAAGGWGQVLNLKALTFKT